MAGRTSYVIILIASAYMGAAAVLHMCWQHSLLLTVIAAPFGGSLAVLSAALLLYPRERSAKSLPTADRPVSEMRPSQDTVGQIGWPQRRRLAGAKVTRFLSGL